MVYTSFQNVNQVRRPFLDYFLSIPHFREKSSGYFAQKFQAQFVQYVEI